MTKRRSCRGGAKGWKSLNLCPQLELRRISQLTHAGGYAIKSDIFWGKPASARAGVLGFFRKCASTKGEGITPGVQCIALESSAAGAWGPGAGCVSRDLVRGWASRGACVGLGRRRGGAGVWFLGWAGCTVERSAARAGVFCARKVDGQRNANMARAILFVCEMGILSGSPGGTGNRCRAGSRGCLRRSLST